MAVIRHIVYYSGQVQGVGFRYTARNLARGYTLAGYVRNLEDRRVLLEVEGDEAELKRFLGEIDETMKQFIAGRTIDRQPATDEFGPPRPGGLSIRF